jgi:hypothetical protein
VRRLIIEETVWYLAVQDGRADNVEYQTEAEAKAVLKKLKRSGRSDLYRGHCVMCHTRFVDP